jgi:hypothetical protein
VRTVHTEVKDDYAQALAHHATENVTKRLLLSHGNAF